MGKNQGRSKDKNKAGLGCVCVCGGGHLQFIFFAASLIVQSYNFISKNGPNVWFVALKKTQ